MTFVNIITEFSDPKNVILDTEMMFLWAEPLCSVVTFSQILAAILFFNF